MRSPWEFLAVALVVTLTPGPATATILRVAGRDGRRAATSAILGNSVGVLLWGSLSAVGVSLLGRHARGDEQPARAPSGWRAGLVTSVSNPKLAAFFVVLLPQFLRPGGAVMVGFGLRAAP